VTSVTIPPGVTSIASDAFSYRCVRRADDQVDPEVKVYQNVEEQCRVLCDVIGQLITEGVKAADIVVLSRRSDTNSIAGLIASGSQRCGNSHLRTLLVPMVSAGGCIDRIRYCSIQAYKGCEAGVVIVTDIDDPSASWKAVDNPEGELRRLLYIAATRTLSRLIVLAHVHWDRALSA